MPRTTLITAIYNRADLLGEAVASALAQTDPDFELILWDDGSTDGSLALAERYAARDKRVRLFSAPNRGFTAVLNAALAESDSPCFGIIDSDDRLAPGALAATVPVLMADPDTGLVYTNHRQIDRAGAHLAPGWNHDVPYSAERLMVEQMVFHFRLFDRAIFDETGGFDPAYAHAEDYDMMLKMSEICHIVKLPAVLYDYRVHEDMISARHAATQRESCRRAIEAALVRRGVADRLMVVVDARGTFSLTNRA